MTYVCRLYLCLCFASITSAHASDLRFNNIQLQMGVDHWHLNLPELSPTVTSKAISNLFLANSNTEWSYQSTSPWIKADGSVYITPQTSFKYKARGEQAFGWKLDDFHLDWALSNKLGVRAGVVDYKTSLCRTYEVDSPWVRENDPFCVNQISNLATLAAPGVQTYLDLNFDNYQVQTLVGVYRPKAFGYASKEFSNVALQAGQSVAVNHRWGWSVSALNLNNAAEVRLSWLGADQETSRNNRGYRGQQGGLWFLGGAFYPLKNVQVRGYLIHTVTHQTSYSDPPEYPIILNTEMFRDSKAIEILYTHSATDAFAVGQSRYDHNWDQVGFNGYESYTNPYYLRFKQQSMSVSWRHNFSHGLHTSVQWTESKNHQIFISDSNLSQAKGSGIGFQLGYVY